MPTPLSGLSIWAIRMENMFVDAYLREIFFEISPSGKRARHSHNGAYARFFRIANLYCLFLPPPASFLVFSCHKCQGIMFGQPNEKWSSVSSKLTPLTQIN